jgi:ATP-dependent exoDNAse (exonuclease V) beta subunit
LAGYAELLVAPRAKKDASQQIVRLKHAADLVAKLHGRNPQLKIAVLTLKNEAVARLRFELGSSGHNIPVGGRGRGTLTDAPAVNTVLDLLQLADHPDDTTAAFNVAASPLAALVKLHQYDGEQHRREIAADVRRRLLDDGYTATIGSWVGVLAASCDRRDLMRLNQLVDLSRQFEDRSTLRPADFVRFVQRVTVEETRPAPVQVMTIHQSKGLEFDIVVLADLEASVTGPTTPAVVYERDGETGPITRICRYVKKEVRAFVPELESMFDRHRQRTVRESLALLYVAITRAKQGLYIIVDPPGEKSKTIPKSLASVLRCALAEAPIEPDQRAFSEGDPNWLDNIESKPVAPDEDTEKLVELKLAPSSGTAPGTIASPSALAETDVASALRLPNEEALDRGAALHGMLEQITWLDDWQPNERILRAIAKRAAPRRGDAWVRQMLESFAHVIKSPAVQKVLGLNGRDPNTLRVLREQPFVRLVDGAIQRGMIDRLEIETIDDKPQSATVIDFKTDLITPQQGQQTAEHYRPQLEAYRAAAAQLLDVKPALVRMVVLFVTAGEVIELG